MCRGYPSMLSRKNMLASGAVGLFVGAFLGYFAWLLYDAEQTYLSWPVVPGRVLEMSIESRRAAKGKNHLYWQVSPRCSYEVNGQEYTGERLSNSPPKENLDWNSQPSPALTQYKWRYPVGSTVQVHYNPDKPERSFLEVDTGGARGFGLAAAASLLVTVLAWGSLLLKWLTRA